MPAGWILLAFTILYAFLGGYLTGMLYAALGIRTDAYRCASGAGASLAA